MLSLSLSASFYTHPVAMFADAILTKMDAMNGKRNIRLNDF